MFKGFVWASSGRCSASLILGGNVNNGAIDGVFCFNVNNLPSNSNWNNGASVAYSIKGQPFLYNALHFPC